jgi:hypothetical protein
MTTDKLSVLASLSDDELLAEIQRRRDEAQRRLDRFTVAVTGRAKSEGKSRAKAAYWAEWREYHAQHPNATVQQWQRSRKKR